MQILRYRLEASSGFGHTTPTVAMTLEGPPSSGTFAVRAMSSIPAEFRFESDGTAGEWITAQTPPYSARAELPAGSATTWRVRVRSLSSSAEVVSDEHTYQPPDLARPLVMGAVSCGKLWDERAYIGLERFQKTAAEPPAVTVYQGDNGYPNNRTDSCYLSAPDFFAERFTRFLQDPHFTTLRRQMPVSFTLDDHDYGPQNNAYKATIAPWAVPLWSHFHADRDDLGYSDWRYGDVHCLTLDGRRYANPIWRPERDGRSKLGAVQKAWLERTLQTSDAALFVIFSADTFATRNVRDTWVRGWPTEYLELMRLFTKIQRGGRRVIILSGDAHSFRVHYHPYPTAQRDPAGPAVIEMICSGLRSKGLATALPGDPTLDPARNVQARSGMGSIEIDPPGTPDRQIRLRVISGDEHGTGDLFPPLVVPFLPGSGPVTFDAAAVHATWDGIVTDPSATSGSA